jgi:hypothetical protein
MIPTYGPSAKERVRVLAGTDPTSVLAEESLEYYRP